MLPWNNCGAFLFFVFLLLICFGSAVWFDDLVGEMGLFYDRVRGLWWEWDGVCLDFGGRLKWKCPASGLGNSATKLNYFRIHNEARSLEYLRRTMMTSIHHIYKGFCIFWDRNVMSKKGFLNLNLHKALVKLFFMCANFTSLCIFESAPFSWPFHWFLINPEPLQLAHPSTFETFWILSKLKSHSIVDGGSSLAFRLSAEFRKKRREFAYFIKFPHKYPINNVVCHSPYPAILPLNSTPLPSAHSLWVRTRGKAVAN